ncbi:hypothetical protein [Flammeovirga sp. EKP202]|uniref:hypothetical protein n=1 Tax=Flammeovirga sp. EKP202 TaxID=2770592 RepID=UPI00165FFFE0|nr:hypothetical protein [Flammeovirga sp. EKP202]MBD0403785.1 hypothetical protein [Flammeovirga sp. EKP202]
MMILYAKSYITLLSILLLLAVTLPLNADSLAPFWDGVLLTHKTDKEITAFIDKTESIDDLVIIANIDGKKVTHKVKKYGRLVRIAISPKNEPEGFILVKKLGFVVSSVRLSEAMPSKEYYLNARMSVMKNTDRKLGYEFTPRRYATIDDSDDDDNEQPRDILPAEKLNTGFTLVEERDPDKINAVIDTSQKYVYASSTIILDEDIQYSGQDQVTTKKVRKEEVFFTNYMLFEKYIHESRYPIYAPKTAKVSTEVKNDARKFDDEYEIITDHYSWLYLSHKTTDERFAFDGEAIFEVDDKYFNIQYENKEKIKDFLLQHHLFIKPYNKKLLGIFYEKNELSAIKSDEEYRLKMLDDNTLVITTGSQNYSIRNDKELLEIKNKKKVILKINKAIFHQEEHFYYRE